MGRGGIHQNLTRNQRAQSLPVDSGFRFARGCSVGMGSLNVYTVCFVSALPGFNTSPRPLETIVSISSIVVSKSAANFAREKPATQ
jgi:hypothetical protein